MKDNALLLLNSKKNQKRETSNQYVTLWHIEWKKKFKRAAGI